MTATCWSVLVNQSANLPSDARLWITCRTCPARASNRARHCQRSRFTWKRYKDLPRDFPWAEFRPGLLDRAVDAFRRFTLYITFMRTDLQFDSLFNRLDE